MGTPQNMDLRFRSERPKYPAHPLRTIQEQALSSPTQRTQKFHRLRQVSKTYDLPSSRPSPNVNNPTYGSPLYPTWTHPKMEHQKRRIYERHRSKSTTLSPRSAKLGGERMNRLLTLTGALLFCAAASAEDGFHTYEYPGYEGLPQILNSEFTVHQPDRAQPQRITPPESNGEMGLPAPSDGTVLFDGSNLDHFQETTWQIVDGNIVAGHKGLVTKTHYGDFQMHVEWKTPADPSIAEKPWQMGNSGLYIMRRYELQIFDSYSSKIYADGSAGAIYGQTPPLVNVCRKPGEWQSYDIVFTAPVFDGESLVSPAKITVLHNGVLIQNSTEIFGPTGHKKANPYVAHPAKQPIVFQAHSSPVEFRNIWIREL